MAGFLDLDMRILTARITIKHQGLRSSYFKTSSTGEDIQVRATDIQHTETIHVP
jgi:hypothetical protein